MAADDPADQAIVTEVIEATLLAVTLPGRVDQRQITRSAEAVHIGFLSFEKQRLQCDGDVLGEADADKSAGGDGVAILDQADGIARRNDLAGV